MAVERILVIDDEPSMIRLCQQALEEGFEVKGALSGEEGLRLLKVGQVANLSFDLTLLDVKLPDRDGLDVLSTIREMDPEMAVVIITGYGTMEVAIAALKSGAQDFLLKPFTPQELVASAQKVLEKKRLIQENLRLKARLPILEISKALMSEVNLERLVQLALETVQQTLEAGRVSLMLLDEERQELSILAALGLPDEVVAATRVKVGQSLAGLAVQRKSPILLPEQAENDPVIQALLIRSDTRQSPEPVEGLVEGSAICMPLILKDRVLGVLNASRPVGGAPFRQDDVDLLSILGGQIAVAIENARLFEQARRDIAERRRVEEALRRIEWLLTRSVEPKSGQEKPGEQPYCDLVEINTCRELVDAVGEDVLAGIVGDYLDLLDTSAAVYEKNGDYALGVCASGWCQLLNQASRNLCGTDDNREALTSGKWHCHESCWSEASKVSIETGQPVDIECRGGVRIYAVPIWAGGEIVGSINFGYGDLPRDLPKLQEVAERYGLSVDELIEQAQSYESRPPFMLDLAKNRLMTSAKLIGTITECKRAEEALIDTNQLLETILDYTHMLVAYLDPQFNLVRVNRAYAETDEREPSFFPGKNHFDLYPNAENEEIFRRVVETGEPYFTYAKPFQYAEHPERGVTYWDWSLVPIKNLEGTVTGLVLTLVNVTERKRAGEALQRYAERLRMLTRQVVSAQEEERHRLSRELHDEAGQALTALKISLDLIQSDLPVEVGSLRQRLGEAVALTETTMEQIRLLAHDLRPPALDAVGLSYTLEGLCLDLAERTRLSIDYAGAELPVLSEALAICLYRFLQEALTNVAKHAQANQVMVALHRDAETVSLSVEDDGQGFDKQASTSAGIGLLGMRERLQVLGGQLEIESRPGQGTRLTARVPLQKAYVERRRADDSRNPR